MSTVYFGILLDALFVTDLVWCAYIDWKTRTVSNLPVGLLLCLGLAHTILVSLAHNTWWLYPAGVLLSAPFLFAWLNNKVGAADVKLIMAIGFYLGLVNTLLSFILMIPILAVLMAYSWIKHKTLKCRIPLAPVLALGAAAAVAFGYLNSPCR